MRRVEFLLVTLLCIAISLSVFYYRSQILGFPLAPDTTTESWHVEARINLNTGGSPVKVNAFLPRFTDQFSIVDENINSNGFGFTAMQQEKSQNRLAEWTKRNPKAREMIYYRAIVYRARSTSPDEDVAQPIISVPVYGSEEFKQKVQTDAAYFALSNIIEELRERSVDAHSFSTELYKLLADKREPRVVQIREHFPEVSTDAAFAVFALKHAGYPARLMNGVAIQEKGMNLEFESWPEVFVKNKWRRYNAEENKLETPDNYLGWWSGDQPFLQTEGAAPPRVTISMREQVESALTEALWRGDLNERKIHDVSVFSLPVHAQLVFSIILLIPLGALVSVFLRQVVGINTFGTFMPVLIALAFRETQLLWGITLFSAIMVMGLLFRSYFDRLQLLMMPRLTAILTLVVIMIYLFSLATFKMGIHAGIAITIFPMVILTMLIERMSITWEEHGAKTALVAAAGSLFSAVMSYLVMTHPLISHLVVTFPELLLTVLAVALWLGRYNGYKLTEYYRFRMLKSSQK